MRIYSDADPAIGFTVSHAQKWAYFYVYPVSKVSADIAVIDKDGQAGYLTAG